MPPQPANFERIIDINLGVADAADAIEQYLVTPSDVPAMAAEKTVGAIADTDEDDQD